MRLERLLISCAVGALAAASGGLAQAQTAQSAPAAPDSGQSASSIGEVIVTAEKREQSVQKVPIAITAFSAKQRDTVGIETLQDMTNFTPGLAYQTQDDNLFVRGIGRQTVNVATDAAVAAYNDGFYAPDPLLILQPSLFSNSVEIFRGPQGTLSGRNGLGGAIEVNSVRPTSTPYAEFRETVGNYDLYDTELAVSGPLTSNINGRLAGYNQVQNQGYFNNVGGGPSEGGKVNTSYLEGIITATLGANTDLFVKAWTYTSDSRGGPGSRSSFNPNPYSTNLNDLSSNLSFNPAAAYNPANILPGSLVQGNPSLTGNPAVGDPRNFASDVPTRVRFRDTYDLNFILTHDFGSTELKWTGGYAQYNYDLVTPGTQPNTDVSSYTVPNAVNPTCVAGGPSCLTIYPATAANFGVINQNWSQELTLASRGQGALQWVGGVYYYHDRNSNPLTIADDIRQTQVATPYYIGLPAAIAGSPAVNPFGLVAAPGNPHNNLVYENYQVTSQDAAVFGQIDYKITDTIKLTGGLRYTHDSKSIEEEERIVLFGGSTLAEAAAPLANPSLNGLLPTQVPGATGNLTTLPAIDLTQAVCAGANATTPAGVKSACVINASGLATRSLGGSSEAVTGTAGIEWTPERSTLVYFRYSRGYKDLGFNAGSLASSPEVAPEHMDDFELGFKRSFGRNLVIDATLFYENYLDAQFPVTELSSVGQTLSDLLSIPKARSTGLELETIWTPVPRLQFLLTYDYNDTAFETGACSPAHPKPGSCYIDSENPNLGPQSINGNAMPNAPKNKVALNGNYTFVFQPGTLTLSASYLWRDRQSGAIFNQAYWQAPSWDQVDLRATWRSNNGKIEVIAYGKNVFNSLGYSTGPQLGQAGAAATPTLYTLQTTYNINPPATYGVELHYKFF